MTSSALIDMQNYTAYEQASQQVNGQNKELNQDMFLKLMLEQLKYQDPLNPMSNQDFLAQQAQFTSLNELQKLNENMLSNNTVQQCVSLIGKEVTLIDPNDTDKTITGLVTEAVFDANGSSITVDGKNYPLGLVIGIRDYKAPAVEDTPKETDTTANTTGDTTEGITSNYSKIAQLAEYILSNIGKYLK